MTLIVMMMTMTLILTTLSLVLTMMMTKTHGVENDDNDDFCVDDDSGVDDR